MTLKQALYASVAVAGILGAGSALAQQSQNIMRVYDSAGCRFDQNGNPIPPCGNLIGRYSGMFADPTSIVLHNYTQGWVTIRFTGIGIAPSWPFVYAQSGCSGTPYLYALNASPPEAVFDGTNLWMASNQGINDNFQVQSYLTIGKDLNGNLSSYCFPYSFTTRASQAILLDATNPTMVWDHFPWHVH